jgi:hypothetical protein
VWTKTVSGVLTRNCGPGVERRARGDSREAAIAYVRKALECLIAEFGFALTTHATNEVS